jgi:hypothetical protein
MIIQNFFFEQEVVAIYKNNKQHKHDVKSYIMSSVFRRPLANDDVAKLQARPVLFTRL